MPTIPAAIDDGDFSIAEQIGCDEYSFPFFNRGDGTSFEVKRKYRIAQTSYKKLEAMARITVTKFNADAFLTEQSDPTNIGNGILDYSLTFSSIPVKRLEGSSVVDIIQILRSQKSFSQGFGPEAGEVVEPEVAEWPLPMNATIIYEYGIGELPQLLAPKIQVILGHIVNYGNWGAQVAGQPQLAFDSESTIYKGGIYQRRSIQIITPNLQVT